MTLSTSSWKTTSAGIALIAGVVVHLWFKRAALTEEDITLAVGGILGGIGLLVARDNDKSSIDLGVDPATKSVALVAQADALRAKASQIAPLPDPGNSVSVAVAPPPKV